jgi:hypothetical protein
VCIDSFTGATGGVRDTCSLSMCAEQVCATEIAACQNDTDCTALVACIAQCPVDDFTCYMNCANAHPNGSVLYGAAEVCKHCTACSVDCMIFCR